MGKHGGGLNQWENMEEDSSKPLSTDNNKSIDPVAQNDESLKGIPCHSCMEGEGCFDVPIGAVTTSVLTEVYKEGFEEDVLGLPPLLLCPSFEL